MRSYNIIYYHIISSSSFSTSDMSTYGPILFSHLGLKPVGWSLNFSPLCCKCMQCTCEGGFCSVLLVWNVFSGPHESGYICLLPQSSPLPQCSTAHYIHHSDPALQHPTLDRELVGGVMTCEPASLFFWLRRDLNPGSSA